MMITDKFIVKFVHEIKNRISEREKDVARARIDDLYSHGRIQGSIDGLEEALNVLTETIEDIDK